MPELRPPQHLALKETKSAYDAGLRRLVVVAATGVGKTVIFSQFPTYLNLGGQLFILAHREELIKQAVDKMRDWNPTLKIGIEMGSEYADLDCDVVVASVPTIGREGTKRLARFDRQRVKCIVTDECHHSLAETYLNVYNYFGALDDKSDVLLVGFTATPGRGDGQALAKVYQKIVYQYTMRQAIEDGWLVDVRGYRVVTDANLDRVKSSRDDFNNDELSKEVDTPANNQKIVKAWRHYASDRQTIAFTTTIQHARNLADMFVKHGYKFAAVWGDDPEREAKLQLFERGALQGLCNVDVLTEGYDNWRVACVINDAPTKSQVKFGQRVGRGTRLQDIKDGGYGNLKEAIRKSIKQDKVDCIVLDAVGSTRRHSLATVPSLFGLSAEMDLKGGSALAAVVAVEKAQKQHPEVDFSTLENIDQIKVMIEEADLWDVKFPEDVLQNSTLSWHAGWDGGFVLNLPSSEQVKIKQNMLDQWEITATIEGQKYKGVRKTMEEAFQCGDTLVFNKAADAIRVLDRGAKWRNEPATEGQLKQLKRKFKGKKIPSNITKGQAGKLLDQIYAKEADELASTAQIALIKKFRRDVPPGLTKRGAKKIIAECIGGKLKGAAA